MRSRGEQVNRFGRMVAAVLAGSLLMAGTAGALVGQKAKKVSTAKYAKTVCGSYTTLADAIDGFVDEYNGITNEDPTAFQSETVTVANGLLDDITKQQKKLKKSYPDIDDGKKVSKLFIANVGELKSEVSGALDKFSAADPTSPAFVGDVTQFEVAFNVLSAKLSDPFSEVDDQDLLKAFDDTKSCEDVVTVFGA
jgi:hypothetical protein